MLKSILIKDYALIENIQVEFGKGLNIITGETGAGKSILIDAMGLLLGERASTEIVRKGAEKSIVEGIFDIEGNKKVLSLLSENEIESNSELIVRREVFLKGTNRCFLNDTPVTLNLIKEVGDLLVDLHGQHEHQSLLKVETHIELLDEISEDHSIIESYRSKYDKLTTMLRELKELTKKEYDIKERKGLYEFQIKEIDEILPEPEEDVKLENELKILENSEKLLTVANEIYDSIYENEDSIMGRVSGIKNKLVELSKIDNSFTEKVNESESLFAILSDISEFVRTYKDRIDLDPDTVEKTRIRIGLLNLLKKKYGGTLKSVIDHREKIGKEFELAENFSDKISELNKEINSLRKECGVIAKKISVNRKSLAKKVKKEVEELLVNLGITDSNFEIRFENQTAGLQEENFIIVDDKNFICDANGYDKIEFFISTNIGEDAKPLVKVASGGEVSRIMLALKSILAKSDNLPILIFDEIDTGISGRIAQKVGHSLKSLASFHQIIAITHLPQIAGISDYHFAVEKRKLGDRVVSNIRMLKNNERINEVAKLISGEKITKVALNSAKELMNLS
ncbi:MAG: DNA repair protein RecN [Bacteroidota bacterium]